MNKNILLFLLASFALWSCESSPVAVEDSVVEITPTLTYESGSSSITVGQQGSEQELSFTTNVDWTLSVVDAQTNASPSWIAVSPMSGSAGNVLISVVVETNTTTESRTAYVTITASSLSKKITIKQEELVPTLAIITESDMLDFEAGEFSVEVSANAEWSVGSLPDWITTTTPSGSGDGVALFSHQANESQEYRQATITVSSYDVTKTILMTQKADLVVESLSIDLSSSEVTADAGDFTLYVSCNSSWSSSEVPDWVTLSPSEGEGDTAVTVEYSENEITSQRTTTFYFKCGSLSEKFTISQAGAQQGGDQSTDEEEDTDEEQTEDETTTPDDEQTTEEEEQTPDEEEQTPDEEETTTPEDDQTTEEEEQTPDDEETTTPEDDQTPDEEEQTPEDEETTDEETTTPEDEEQTEEETTTPEDEEQTEEETTPDEEQTPDDEEQTEEETTTPDDEETEEDEPSEQETIPTSVSYTTQWPFNSGDKIAVSAFDSSTSLAVGSSVPYIFSDGTFTSDEPIEFSSTDTSQKLLHYAVFPYIDSTTFSFAAQSDQSSQSNYEASALLTSVVTASDSREPALNFYNRMASVTITLSSSNIDISDAAVSVNAVKGVACNITTGSYLASGDAESIATYSAVSNTFTAYVAPQTIASGSAFITVTVGGKSYSLASTSEITLSSGGETTLSLTVTETELTFQGEINPWVDGDSE